MPGQISDYEQRLIEQQMAGQLSDYEKFMLMRQLSGAKPLPPPPPMGTPNIPPQIQEEMQRRMIPRGAPMRPTYPPSQMPTTPPQQRIPLQGQVSDQEQYRLMHERYLQEREQRRKMLEGITGDPRLGQFYLP